MSAATWAPAIGWVVSIAGIVLVAFVGFMAYILYAYGHIIRKIFETRPLFMAPRVEPDPTAESVEFSTPAGRRLAGSYLKSRSGRRRGVVLFCHEFSADRWLASSYVGYLRDAGFDVFTFDFNGHGASDAIEGYQPAQWVTQHEVDDVESAIAYLKTREEFDGAGIALFGVSKGGGSGLVAAARDRRVRAIVTDGAFPTPGTVTQYEMRWVEIYSTYPWIYSCLPRSFYSLVCELVLSWQQHRRRVRYPRIEAAMRRLGSRPLLMIHGERDNYINEDIVRRLHQCKSDPRELWLVPKAKHNGCLEVAGDEYRGRVTRFFEEHLTDGQMAGDSPTSTPL